MIDNRRRIYYPTHKYTRFSTTQKNTTAMCMNNLRINTKKSAEVRTHIHSAKKASESVVEHPLYSGCAVGNRRHRAGASESDLLASGSKTDTQWLYTVAGLVATVAELVSGHLEVLVRWPHEGAG
jgi:hypothetical protein